MKRLFTVLTSLLLLSACSGPDSSGGVALNKDNTSGIDFGAIKGPMFPDGSCKGLPDKYDVLTPFSGNVVSDAYAQYGEPQVYAIRAGGPAEVVAGVYYIGPGTNLRDRKFSNWALCRMNLTGANLTNGGFWGGYQTSSYRFSILNRVQMERGSLWQADFSYSQINNANLKGVHMRASWFNGSRITFTNLTGVDLESAKLNNVNFTGSNLSKANLTVARVHGANFTRANLAGANLNSLVGFDSAIWTDVQFDESTICPNNRPRGQIGHNCPF